MALNEKYSYHDFMHQSFTDVPVSEFNNSEIVGSCFYQENKPNHVIFPSGMTGVTFRKCNLDNVQIPPTCIVQSDCSLRKIRVQNDFEDWVLDNSLKPVEPVNKKVFLGLGLSVDPADIPLDFIRKECLTKNEWDRDKNNHELLDWFLETPQIIKQETLSVKKTISKIAWDATADKSKWVGDYNNFPIMKVETSPDRFGVLQEVMILTGDITYVTISGKGYFLRLGLKNRPYMNQSVTAKKERAD